MDARRFPLHRTQGVRYRRLNLKLQTTPRLQLNLLHNPGSRERIEPALQSLSSSESEGEATL